ncbi:unnamed protein product [Rhizophagus irregularis]|uniref:Uncharacterized protein n=1 Tax=Rhizophagus irregularis TaxID=588596 RepID=A0A916EBD8_9GLOM|nr:unnamed protein product [Rhizophagus irregularis]
MMMIKSPMILKSENELFSEKLIRKPGLYELKPSPAEAIMELKSSKKSWINYFIGESSRSTKPEFRKFTQKPAILDNIQDPKTGISRSSAQSRPKIPSAIPSGVLRFITSSTISQRSC